MNTRLKESPAAVPEVVARWFTPELAANLAAFRRDIHRHPELSFQEHRTARKIQEALEPLKPVALDRVADTAVVARIAGADSNAPIVAVRGDIDALPIHEATGLEFASENDGVMHACGHDVHTTWTLGVAHLLAQQPAHGDVLILFQPAEETGRGALSVLETGALDGVAAIVGGHVDRRFPIGQVVAGPGHIAASSDSFTIQLTGRGAHGARPHESADPVVGLGALIAALQTIVSRRVNPVHPAVVTVGKVSGGSAPNVIPETVALEGTLRATSPETRAQLEKELRAIAASVAAAYGLSAQVELSGGTPPVVNPETPSAWAQEAARSILGEDAVVPLGTLNMAGEDFAYYMDRMPGCFMRIGAREEGGDVIPAHTPYFYAAEESIYVGAAVLAETARVASRALAGA